VTDVQDYKMNGEHGRNPQSGRAPTTCGSLALSGVGQKQYQQSGNYQHGNENTHNDRNNPMPTARGLSPFRSGGCLCGTDTNPKAHRSIPRYMRGRLPP